MMSRIRLINLIFRLLVSTVRMIIVSERPVVWPGRASDAQKEYVLQFVDLVDGGLQRGVRLRVLELYLLALLEKDLLEIAFFVHHHGGSGADRQQHCQKRGERGLKPFFICFSTSLSIVVVTAL